ncbi:MAG TPA: hypothetical protein VIC25_08810, partial [Caulobacteraceae bacterium]
MAAPPFLIRVPVKHNRDLQGVAVAQINAMLEGLGNPASEPVREALEATGVIHFLSLSVVWNRNDDDPPMLVAHVAGDGRPGEIIRRLVDHAGSLLLPIFQAAASGIDS